MSNERDPRDQGIGPKNQVDQLSQIEQIIKLDREGEKYNAFVNWFNISKEQRELILKNNLRSASKRTAMSYLPHAKNAEDCPPVEKFILTNFSILSSGAAEKLFVPVGTITISEREDDEITDDGGRWAWDRFNKFVRENKIKLEADMDDFYSPSGTIRRFSVEEIKTFLSNLSDHISPESQLFDWNKIVHPIKHADLLADPRLTAFVERSVVSERGYGVEMHLANYLCQEVYPSPEFFEEFFRRRKEECDPNVNYQISVESQNDKIVPASLYYFTFLRRINQITKQEIEGSRQKVEKKKQRIVSYLLSDEFMKRALPYLDTDEVYGNERWGDEFIRRGHVVVFYENDIEAIGDEAKRIKRQRFSEVLKAAASYLGEKGDYDTVRRLKEKEVDGVKFADFFNLNL